MKTEKFKSAAAIALAVMICATSLTACGSGGKKTNAGADAPKQSQQTEPKKSSKKDSKADSAVKKDDAAKLPAADSGRDQAPKDSAAKDEGKSDAAQKKADTAKGSTQKSDAPAAKAPAASKNVPSAGKVPTVKSGK